MMLSQLVIALLIIYTTEMAFSEYTTYDVDEECIIGDGKFEHKLGSTTGQSSSIILKGSSYGTYSRNRNCTIYLRPSSYFAPGVVASIRKMNFPPPRVFGCRDYIKIYDSSTSKPNPLCGYEFIDHESKSYASVGSMRIDYHMTNGMLSVSPIGFELVATAFTNAPCLSYEYHCDNNRCIWEGLTCDGHNNCGDNSDERFDACLEPELKNSFLRDSIIMSICGFLVSIVLITSIVLYCLRKKRTITNSGALPPMSPYQATHPCGYFICQNPAGPSTLYPPQSTTSANEEGITNPCYPSGIPEAPPSYKP